MNRRASALLFCNQLRQLGNIRRDPRRGAAPVPLILRGFRIHFFDEREQSGRQFLGRACLIMVSELMADQFPNIRPNMPFQHGPLKFAFCGRFHI
jgi:hypothetical protein